MNLYAEVLGDVASLNAANAQVGDLLPLGEKTSRGVAAAVLVSLSSTSAKVKIVVNGDLDRTGEVTFVAGQLPNPGADVKFSLSQSGVTTVVLLLPFAKEV